LAASGSAALHEVIVDTSRLQSEEFWSFLARWPDNTAILPDYVPIEVEGLGAALL
jgi:hypothetical protein